MSESAQVVRTLVGRITSDKRQATRTVEVEWSRRHPRYGKVVRGQTTYHIHDPQDEAHVGDLVRIKQGRPVSKTKSWYLVEVVERAKKEV